MKWWQWDITKPGCSKGGVFDPSTYAGLLRGVVFSSFLIYVFWQFNDWCLNTGLITNPREHQWWRLVSMVFLGFGYVITLVAAIYIFVQRRKLKKSTEGQWYDTQNLTKRDLEYGDPDADDGDKQEIKG